MTTTLTRKARPPELAAHNPRFRLLPMWYRQATCASFDWRLWFPPNPRSRQVELAKAICQECPIKKWCARDALNSEGSLPESGVIRAGVYLPSPTKRGQDRLRQRTTAIRKLEKIAA